MCTAGSLLWAQETTHLVDGNDVAGLTLLLRKSVNHLLAQVVHGLHFCRFQCKLRDAI